MRRLSKKFMVICINADDLIHRTRIYNDFDVALESFKARVGEITLDMIHDAEEDSYGGSKIDTIISDLYADPIYFVDKNGNKVARLPMTAREFEEKFDNYIELSSHYETIAFEIVEEEM